MLYAICTTCISYLGCGAPQNSESVFPRAIFCWKQMLRFTVFDFERTPHPRFTSKLSLKGLKMTGRPFSAKIIFQNLTPIFRFYRIPGGQKKFFFLQKRVHEKSNSVFIPQYFLTGPGSYKR